jgi:hypothetical protein
MDPGSLISDAKNNLDAAIAVIKIYKNAKESIDEIEQESKFLELKSSILDAKDNVLDLRSALIEKDEEIQKLKEELKVQNEIKFEPPVYWHITDDGKDGPFCQKCYDVDKNLVRLQIFDSSHEGAWNCTACQSHYRTKEYSEWSNQQLS